MGNRSSDYIINTTTFSVIYGDITKVVAEALISSDDNYLSMGGGVSMAIEQAGGEEIRQHARKLLPLRVGDVAVTSAGRLPAKYIFHAVTIDYNRFEYPSDISIHSATQKCMQLADILKLRTIAFPALGTGEGGFPFQTAAEVMTRTIAEYLTRKTQVELVTIALLAREGVQERDRNLFYERAVALASISCQTKRLASLLDELRGFIEPIQRKDLLERVEGLRTELFHAQDVLAERPSSLEQIEQQQERSAIADVSQRIVTMTTQTQKAIQTLKVSVWGDRQLEQEVMRTKLNGLLTQLNIKSSQMNKFQIEKAKYGGIDVPPRLENAIEDLDRDIQGLEADTSKAREQLAALMAS